MALTLGALALPQGLRWADEFDWSPIVQATTYSLSGALILEESARLAGRPITLSGARDGNISTAWLKRDDLIALQTALNATGATFTLTLHDARTFTVAPRADGDGPLSVEPLPAVKNFAPADPDADTWYIVNTIRLMEV